MKINFDRTPLLYTVKAVFTEKSVTKDFLTLLLIVGSLVAGYFFLRFCFVNAEPIWQYIHETIAALTSGFYYSKCNPFSYSPNSALRRGYFFSSGSAAIISLAAS